MSNSTKIPSGGIATFAIKINGTAIPDLFSVLSIYVEKKVNRIALAKIVILDGEANTGKFDASSSAIFVPGAAISIEAGYDSQNKTIFKGLITAQSIRIDSLVGSALEVECRDESVKMIAGRKSHTFSNKKDSEIISSIIASYSGLVSEVIPTDKVSQEQVQYLSLIHI